MTLSAQHLLVTLAIIALIGWRMHSRIRRSIGRQRLSRIRPWITVVLFPLVTALLALAALRSPEPIPGFTWRVAPWSASVSASSDCA